MSANSPAGTSVIVDPSECDHTTEAGTLASGLDDGDAVGVG